MSQIFSTEINLLFFKYDNIEKLTNLSFVPKQKDSKVILL